MPNRHILINMVSQRVRQLIAGFRPLTTTESSFTHMDIALKEISEGKVGFTLPDQKELAEERARKRRKRTM